VDPTDGLILLVALGASAFFSAAESALFSLSRLRLALLAKEPSREARAIVRTMERPNAALATILIGNNFANLGGTAFATAVAIQLFGEDALAIVVPVMTGLILVLTEIVPKTTAIAYPDTVARGVIRLLDAVSAVVWPLRAVLVGITDRLLALVERSFDRSRLLRGTEESTTVLLKAAVEVGYDEGILAPFEKEIFDNISEVHDLEVREVMTPRTEIFALPASTAVADARRTVRERGLSRVPVYEGRFENLVGLLHAVDLLPAREAERGLRPLLKPLLYVPETKPVVDLLVEFRAKGVHFAVAVEESGGIAGIVTLEDILEEIVGEIRDERHVAHQRYVWRGQSTIIVSARMEIALFNETFGVSVESPDAETIGGFLMARTGRIPRTGEILFFDGLRFLVRRAEPHRVVELEVTKFPVVEAESR
jgi:putative hemolysin